MSARFGIVKNKIQLSKHYKRGPSILTIKFNGTGKHEQTILIESNKYQLDIIIVQVPRAMTYMSNCDGRRHISKERNRKSFLVLNLSDPGGAELHRKRAFSLADI